MPLQKNSSCNALFTALFVVAETPGNACPAFSGLLPTRENVRAEPSISVVENVCKKTFQHDKKAHSLKSAPFLYCNGKLLLLGLSPKRVFDEFAFLRLSRERDVYGSENENIFADFLLIAVEGKRCAAEKINDSECKFSVEKVKI